MSAESPADPVRTGVEPEAVDELPDDGRLLAAMGVEARAVAAESFLVVERERREAAEAELAKLNEEKNARAKRGEWRWDDYDALLEAAGTELDRLRASLDLIWEESQSAAEIIADLRQLRADRGLRAGIAELRNVWYRRRSLSLGEAVDSLDALLAGSGVSEAATEAERCNCYPDPRDHEDDCPRHAATESEPCVYCKDSKWVEDQNWSPEHEGERRRGREPHSGLIPCGGCNLGGWDAPWPPVAATESED